MVVLRQFLYRDDELIKEFLAQIEGGIFDEDTRKTSASDTRGRSGGIHAGPVKGGVERDREDSTESEMVVRQTGASEFERLYNSLDSTEAIQFLESCDDEIWNQIRRGEILEIEAIIRPAGLEKVAEMFGMFADLLPLAELTGADVDLDEEQIQTMQLVKQLGNLKDGATVDVVAELAGARKYQFGCSLQTSALRVDADILQGESTLIGKMQRKLKKGETHLLGNLFGGLEQILDKKSKKELADIFNAPEAKQLGLANPRLSYPAAIITPIAIYR